MLYEKYRPRSFADFLGNADVVANVRRVIEAEGFTGAAFWIDGPSGTGKSTLAELIVSAVGAADIETERLDGSKCTGPAVERLAKALRCRPMFGRFHAVIVNEAHAMTAAAVQAWLTWLEDLQREARPVVVIFTTTEGRKADLFGTFDSPFKSRCLLCSLSSYGLNKTFAAAAKRIAEAEGLDGQPIARYERRAAECQNNMRALLSAIEAGEMLASK